MFNARILADSINPRGYRVTTMEWTFPRCILAEVNTHRMLSRNAASSRAIPTQSLIQRVIDNPFIPEFRENKKGMQAGGVLDDNDAETAVEMWLEQRDRAVEMARTMHHLNIHKQYVNRLLEPWMWCTIIVSATTWENVWKLRCHPDAEPSFQRIAGMARDAMAASMPVRLLYGDCHLPLIDPDELIDNPLKPLVSVGRCARVSYLTHEGKRDPDADVELANRLSVSGHWSPFEHVAYATAELEPCGNFQGWKQLRKAFMNESGVN